MENGSYFFIKDDDASNRQSIGVLLVHNSKIGDDIFLYCMEYAQFWRHMSGSVVMDEVDFKKPHISPVAFGDLLESNFAAHISGVVNITDGRVINSIQF
ncbi:hypothetical protein ACFQ3P_30195 [Paraburkholderia sabiae]|uniref:Uncharacterized protein n=1 Tax=Paraburkholderia sabiae TaxID=273251 RepID=A0ABU9QNZ3_9BURK|nr:hypothetical protein [Paraburkholderia sabiae]WJZ74908.1 hypothetical protein QEN71_03575 [Paraburkholderia sabiae]